MSTSTVPTWVAHSAWDTAMQLGEFAPSQVRDKSGFWDYLNGVLGYPPYISCDFYEVLAQGLDVELEGIPGVEPLQARDFHFYDREGNYTHYFTGREVRVFGKSAVYGGFGDPVISASGGEFVLMSLGDWAVLERLIDQQQDSEDFNIEDFNIDQHILDKQF